ncbi:hypothetical protein [Agromyces larvae]|uniref:Phage portal protein n=1 Tax=Agromyces larvae TaxID=2929802 RepID=A0ABY4C3D5_9MICO|nr:hypothetical protein [Agromyces larvae]UOE45980.1 hypothetical protein MTO99_09625 [Agromyces larvae]
MSTELEHLAETLMGALEAQDSGHSKEFLRESFDRVMDLIKREDIGWLKFRGTGHHDDPLGLSLEDLKKWSGQIRESVVGAPWIGRGLRLRHSNIWRGGIQYKGVPKGGSQGVRDIQKLIDDPRNQRAFFGKTARRRREGSLYHDGVAFWIGNERRKILEPIPLEQITGQIEDPDGLGEIWAYRREWTKRNLETGKTDQMIRWYFTDQYVEHRVKSIKVVGGKSEIVDQAHVIFDQHANSMVGMMYGSPDALAAYIWNGIARDAFMDGRTMTQAMATFAFKASVGTPRAGENASMKYADATTPGSTAVLGATQDLVPLASAGKGYDFTSLRALTAIVAAALDVSNAALTADSTDASFRSAASLDLPTRLLMEVRRDEHIDFDERVLRWMGAKDAVAYFIPFTDDSDVYRKVQAAVLKWNTGLYSEDDMKAELEAILGNPLAGDVPDGVLLPNNTKTLAATKPATASTASTAAPDQGRSNGTGGQDSSGSDIR